MTYEPYIIDILSMAGDNGLTIQKIARHVHHEVNTFFAPISYEEVYGDVKKFVYKNSQNSYSLLCHATKHGHYRLNRNSEKMSQLLFDFE